MPNGIELRKRLADELGKENDHRIEKLAGICEQYIDEVFGAFKTRRLGSSLKSKEWASNKGVEGGVIHFKLKPPNVLKRCSLTLSRQRTVRHSI